MKNNNNDIDQWFRNLFDISDGTMDDWFEQLEAEHRKKMARLRSLGGWIAVGLVVWLAFVGINW